MVPGSARLKDVVMKKFFAFTLSALLLSSAQADPINDAVTGLSNTISDQMTINLWTNRCARPEALRLHANCYVNPEGVPLWQMTGTEREKWKPTAIQEKIRLQREYQNNVEVAKEQGKMTAQKYKLNQQMCDFWKQQTKSQKQQKKMAEHCGDMTNR